MLPPIEAPMRVDADSRRGGMEIFDPLRKKWVALTPEEWVRQHFTAFMIAERGFPAALMGNEIALNLNGTSKRCDTVVYTQGLRPLCIVEYKAPEVNITQKVFDQIARYNSVLQAPYLIVSNGMRHFCIRYTASGYRFLPQIPMFSEMLDQ